jgi:hypothetical protein
VVQVNYLVLEIRPRIWLFEILDDEVGLRNFILLFVGISFMGIHIFGQSWTPTRDVPTD